MISNFRNIQFVFLDRDGVINRKPPEGEYVARWEDFHLLPGAASAIAALNKAGIRVLVVSNQRGVALGRYTRADVDAIHSRLQEELALQGAHIDGFYYCPHDRNECDCRKPKTGLFEQAVRDFPTVTRTNSILIGDSLSDVQAAHNFGIPAIFILGDPATRKPGGEKAAGQADGVADSLEEVVRTNLPASLPANPE